MRTIVKLHLDCRRDMAAWISRWPGQEKHPRELLRIYVDALLATLTNSEGSESVLADLGAIRVSGVQPPLYVWEHDNLVVRFAVRKGYRNRWIEKHLPTWLAFLFPPTVCRITVLRLLP